MAVLDHSTYHMTRTEFIHNMAESLFKENKNHSLSCPQGEYNFFKLNKYMNVCYTHIFSQFEML